MKNQIIQAKIVKIGNSRGIRIPRAMLEQAGLYDVVEMKVDGDRLVIQPAHKSRQGWEAKFTEMANNGDDRLLDDYFPNEWDESEWEW